MLERYHYTQTELDKLLNSMVVLVDTREHDGKNDHILNYFDSKGIAWKKQKLDYGDYSCMLPANEELGIVRDLYFDKEIMVERKANLDEFAGNCVNERNRIKKEFSMGPSHKVLLIENGSYADMVNGNYKSEYAAKSYFGTIHSFWHEFDLPVVFMPDPKYSGMFIRGYLTYYIRGLVK